MEQQGALCVATKNFMPREGVRKPRNQAGSLSPLWVSSCNSSPSSHFGYAHRITTFTRTWLHMSLQRHGRADKGDSINGKHREMSFKLADPEVRRRCRALFHMPGDSFLLLILDLVAAHKWQGSPCQSPESRGVIDSHKVYRSTSKIFDPRGRSQ